MAVNLEAPAQLEAISGIELATAASQSRYTNRDDLLLIKCAPGSSVAGVFTKNRYCAAPVTIAKAHMLAGNAQAMLVNAGNANAGTGSLGLENAVLSCQSVATSLGLKTEQVLPFSTGVIGEQLPMDMLLSQVTNLTTDLSPDNWLAAARAIMTTDTVAKGVSEKIEIDGHTITLTGIAKGSGMICPNMATMLAYVATDAVIGAELLQALLERANEQSFNRITVDGDTSTNDALILIATGHSPLSEIRDIESPAATQFYAGLEKVLVRLATSVVRDGEGATKFVRIEVRNAQSQSDAKAIAYSVAHSPLVKTALFASDPNWGRILAAVGKADVSQLDLDRVSIQINGLDLIEAGEPAKSYSEELGKAEFEKAEITIDINLNLAAEDHHVWTSDLSHDYVSINADYRS